MNTRLKLKADEVTLKGNRYFGSFNGTRTLTYVDGSSGPVQIYSWSVSCNVTDAEQGLTYPLSVNTYFFHEKIQPPLSLRSSLIHFGQRGRHKGNSLAKKLTEGYLPKVVPNRYPGLIDITISDLLRQRSGNERAATLVIARPLHLQELVEKGLCVGVNRKGFKTELWASEKTPRTFLNTLRLFYKWITFR